MDYGAESGDSEMQFSFEVAIDGVEGATSLDGEFTSANIELTFDTPVDGKARFTATPPPDAVTSFFLRAKVK